MSNLISQKVQYINQPPIISQQGPKPPVQNSQPQKIQPKTAEEYPKLSILKRHKNLAEVVILGSLGICSYFLLRGKGSKLPNFAPHIEFVEAKTVEEARAFAKRHFGTLLELGDNLDFSNYVNKVLVKINNRMRGKAQMPGIVKFSESENDGYWGTWQQSTKILTIGSSYRDLVKLLKEKNVPIEKYLVNAIKSGGKAGMDAREIEKTIPHEIGHATHFTYSPEASFMYKLEILQKLGLDKKLTQQFLEDIKYTKGLEGVYDHYSLSCPSEFVAETFAYKILGRNLHPDIEKLYTKYKGPKVPEVLDLAA